MRIDELKKAHRSQPFEPFTIRVADGREYDVVHPEFLAFSATGRTIVVMTPDDLFEIIDTMMITSIHMGNGRRKPRGKRK